MDAHGAERIADEWINAWNVHDLERTLSLHSDGVTLVSEMVRSVTGCEEPKVFGKAALRAYWRQGLEHFPDLRFRLIGVYPGSQSVVLLYHAVAGLVGAEFMRLDADGKICEVHAHYRRGDATSAAA